MLYIQLNPQSPYAAPCHGEQVTLTLGDSITSELKTVLQGEPLRCFKVSQFDFLKKDWVIPPHGGPVEEPEFKTDNTCAKALVHLQNLSEEKGKACLLQMVIKPSSEPFLVSQKPGRRGLARVFMGAPCLVDPKDVPVDYKPVTVTETLSWADLCAMLDNPGDIFSGLEYMTTPDYNEEVVGRPEAEEAFKSMMVAIEKWLKAGLPISSTNLFQERSVTRRVSVLLDFVAVYTFLSEETRHTLGFLPMDNAKIFPSCHNDND